MVLGVAFLYSSARLNENLDGKIYMIQISIDARDLNKNPIKPLYLQPFLFYYDFSSQEGNISFRINHDLYFENINLIIPGITENDTLSIYVLKNNSKIELTQEEDYNHYLLSRSSFTEAKSHLSINPSRKFEKSDVFVIQFKSDIIPKAVFNFVNQRAGNLVLYEAGDDGNINFKLGEKYQCLSPCVYGFKNVEETFKSFEGYLRLKWNNTDANNLFYLNTFSRSKKFWKDFLMSFGVSLLIAGLVFILTKISKKSSKDTKKLWDVIDGRICIKGIGKKTLQKIRDSIK